MPAWTALVRQAAGGAMAAGQLRSRAAAVPARARPAAHHTRRWKGGRMRLSDLLQQAHRRSQRGDLAEGRALVARRAATTPATSTCPRRRPRLTRARWTRGAVLPRAICARRAWSRTLDAVPGGAGGSAGRRRRGAGTRARGAPPTPDRRSGRRPISASAPRRHRLGQRARTGAQSRRVAAGRAGPGARARQPTGTAGFQLPAREREQRARALLAADGTGRGDAALADPTRRERLRHVARGTGVGARRPAVRQAAARLLPAARDCCEDELRANRSVARSLRRPGRPCSPATLRWPMRAGGWPANGSRWATNDWVRATWNSPRRPARGSAQLDAAAPGLADFERARARRRRPRPTLAPRRTPCARRRAPPPARNAARRCRRPLRGEPVPQRFVVVQRAPPHRRSPAASSATSTSTPSRRCMPSTAHGGRHHRLAVRHAQVDLALDPGAVAQRRHRDAHAVHAAAPGRARGRGRARRAASASARDLGRRTSPPTQWKRTSGSRARMRGNTSRTNHSTASTFGGWRKPPTNTRSWRCAEGRRRHRATSCRLDSTSHVARRAHRAASSSRSTALTTSVVSASRDHRQFAVRACAAAARSASASPASSAPRRSRR